MKRALRLAAHAGFLLTIASLILPTISNAAPGSLDSTFDFDGKVTTDFASSSDAGNSVAIQSDGKIVVAGSSGIYFGLVRYNSDGSLDITFGTGGKQTTSFGNNADTGNAIALQSDGKIVVAGTGGTLFYSYFDLSRYQSNGTLDNTFGSSGVSGAAFDGLQSRDFANAVAIQTDGKIVVAGQSGAFGPSAIAVARFFSNGNLDNTFGTGGLAKTSFGSNDDYGKSLAIQSDGKIVVGGYGYTSAGSNDDFEIARFLSDGTIDSTFGFDGQVITDFANDDDHGNSIAIQSDGKIVIAGQSWTGLNIDYALARYNADGSLDATFGTGGKLTTAIGSADDIATSLAIQSDGKIVVAGISQGLADNEFSLVRYNSNGTLDITFGTGGKLTTPFGGADDNGHSVAIQTDGKIVVAGSSNSGSGNDFAVARYDASRGSTTTGSTGSAGGTTSGGGDGAAGGGGAGGSTSSGIGATGGSTASAGGDLSTAASGPGPTAASADGGCGVAPGAPHETWVILALGLGLAVRTAAGRRGAGRAKTGSC